MMSRTLITALAAGTILSATAAFTWRSVAPEPQASTTQADDPLDPLAVIRGLCGRGGANPFQAKLRLAAAVSQVVEPADATVPPPLFTSLGDRSWPITTDVPEAQAYFDQGLRFAYGFNHAEAARAFRHAQRLDPDCAMCFWGEALVLGPNINAPMNPDDNVAALVAVARAQALADRTAPTEQALIKALAQRYSAAPHVERATLDGRYADAMAQVAADFPDDHDIAALAAEAMMDTQPWDYWEADGATPKGRAPEILAILERVLAAEPDHPVAIHLYIHAVEASTTPERAEPYAERLSGQMPGSGHLEHMPSHIYYRIGRFRDSLDVNASAIGADETYFAESGAGGFYRYSYYPHNIHFVVVSAQMGGDKALALSHADKLGGVLNDAVTAQVPWIQLIQAAPYFAYAQLASPDEMLALADPGDRFPYVQASWRYMRGVAHALAGDTEAAAAEAAAIAALAGTTDWSGEVAGGLPAPALLEIMGKVIAARVAQARGDHEAAVVALRQAIAAEDTLPYLEPPYWYYPLRQSLGAAQVLAGHPDDAQQTFVESLARSPNNAWSLYGLWQARLATGDEAGAAVAQKRFEEAWLGGSAAPAMTRL